MPRDVDCIPSVVDVSFSPGTIRPGESLGERSTLSVTFRDHPDSDVGPGFDPYVSERSYDPMEQGTFWGRFRARQPFLRGVPIRMIQGYVGQALEDMEARNFFVESPGSLSPSGEFTIDAKDIFKQLDGDRAQAPVMSNGFLLADIGDTDRSLTLSPSGIGDQEYDETGLIAIGGKEIVAFARDLSAGNDANCVLLLHMDGADGSTTFTDSSLAPHTMTANGNVQIDNAQSVFGGTSALFDGSGDFISTPDHADWTFAGNFTIDARVRITSLAADRAIVCHSTDGNNGWRFYVVTNGALVFQQIIGGVANITAGSPAGAIVVNQTYHVSVVRSGTSFKVRVNGVEVGALTSATAISNFTGTLKVGIGVDGVNYPMAGWIDELRISKVARWTSDFTPPPAPYATSSDICYITRARLNTEAQAHKAQDRAQAVLEIAAADVADIISMLMQDYADVSPDYIPIEDWLSETENFLGTVYTTYIAEPTSVRKLIDELIEQAALCVWWNDLTAKTRLTVLRSISTDAALFDENSRIKGSFSVAEQADKRVSQVWTYFGQINPLKSIDDLDNYRSVTVTVDGESETDYGSSAIKIVRSRWIPQFGRAVAQTLNNKLIGRFQVPPRKMSFGLARYSDSEIELGLGYQVGSHTFQDVSGARVDVPIQVTRLIPGPDRYTVEAEEMRFISIDEDVSHVVPIDADAYNVNLRDAHDSLYPEAESGDVVTCIVYAGVTVGSTSTSIPALLIGDWAVGVVVNVEVRGRIQGKGGAGGSGAIFPAEAGKVGGAAIYTRYAINLDVTSGEIWGGAGGGGAGGKGPGSPDGGGGGGGSGSASGPGGAAGANGAVAGASGTASAGGVGGAGSGAFGGRAGGSGGGPGLVGSSGTSGTAGAGASGGAAGNAIDGVSYVTVTAGPGDIRGPQIN